MYEFELAKTRPGGKYEGFDYTSFSAEVGITKHDPQVFQATLDHFGVPANKALFVDDVLLYTQNAASIGINVIWADKTKYLTPQGLAKAILDQLQL